MKLVDQWHDIENRASLQDWESVRLTLTTEQASDLPRAAQVLGPINAGKVGSTLVVPRSAGSGATGRADGAPPLQPARRGADLVSCIEPSDVGIAAAPAPHGGGRARP